MKLLPTYEATKSQYVLKYIANYDNKYLVGMNQRHNKLVTLTNSYTNVRHYISNGLGHKNLKRITP